MRAKLCALYIVIAVQLGCAARVAGPDPLAKDCAHRQCGPDPVTHRECGTCSSPGLLACNDGKCQARCDETACARMSFAQNTCAPRGPCDGYPPGESSKTTFRCSADRTTCEGHAEAIDCGAADTDCTRCDLRGKGDGSCHDNKCQAQADPRCK